MRVLVLGATGQLGSNLVPDTIASPPPSNLYVTANLKNLGITALADLMADLPILAPFGTQVRYPNEGSFSRP